MKQLAVVGAGITGRLLAHLALKAGFAVRLFDKLPQQSQHSASFTAAGMLSPAAEIVRGNTTIYHLGQRSLSLWPSLIENLAPSVEFHQQGSLLLAHGQDQAELSHFKALLDHKLGDTHHAQSISAQHLAKLEPDLKHHQHHALWLSNEAYVDSEQLMQALELTLLQQGVIWHASTEITTLEPYFVQSSRQTWDVDVVCDCRGLGAQTVYPDLRAVRGELIHLHAPDVYWQRPVRLLHPRYHVYIVPRADHHYLIGASEIDNLDYSPISVRSCLELLSAAFSLHPGFAEARIIKTMTQCRAAFADNEPRIDYQPGLLRCNGLYRHGFLLAPALVYDCLQLLQPTETTP